MSARDAPSWAWTLAGMLTAYTLALCGLGQVWTWISRAVQWYRRGRPEVRGRLYIWREKDETRG